MFIHMSSFKTKVNPVEHTGFYIVINITVMVKMVILMFIFFDKQYLCDCETG